MTDLGKKFSVVGLCFTSYLYTPVKGLLEPIDCERTLKWMFFMLIECGHWLP